MPISVHLTAILSLSILSLLLPSTWGFLLGISYALCCTSPYQSQMIKISKQLLQVCVVGLGFGINAHTIFDVGQKGILLTVISMLFTLFMGGWLGRRLGVNTHPTLLISSGTAICGGSAIAAVASVIKPKSQDISVALSTVFGLNALALLVFPMLGRWLGLSDEQFGLWAAIAIHDTSSVVGAAQQFSDKALAIATTVKLQRALWIIPLVLILAQRCKNNQSAIKIPWFIFLFILAMVINTIFPSFQEISTWLNWGAKKGLALTLFLIGASCQWTALKAIGLKPLIFGATLWLIVSVLSLIFIVFL